MGLPVRHATCTFFSGCFASILYHWKNVEVHSPMKEPAVHEDFAAARLCARQRDRPSGVIADHAFRRDRLVRLYLPERNSVLWHHRPRGESGKQGGETLLTRKANNRTTNSISTQKCQPIVKSDNNYFTISIYCVNKL